MKWRELNQSPATRLDQMRRMDPYALFSVAEDAPLSDVKRAYREMVRIYHPDRADPFMQSYCDEALKVINEAMKRIEREQQKNDQDR